MKKVLNKLLPLAYGLYFNTLALFAPKRVAKKAFLLFCTPRKGRVLAEQKDFLEKAKKEKIQVGDLQLQTYHWEGSNETVLLLHGWESNTFRWRNLISFLKEENYNIVAFDAPAHGHSTGEIFNLLIYTESTQAIIKKYGPKIIIGHSMGGMTVLYHQQKYPTKEVEKIVTIGSPSRFNDFMLQYQDTLGLTNRVLLALDDYIFDRYGIWINDISTSEFEGHLDKKGLVIHDELDTIAPYSASKDVHAAWKNSELFTTKGLGHSMHQDEVSQRIIAFIKL